MRANAGARATRAGEDRIDALRRRVAVKWARVALGQSDEAEQLEQLAGTYGVPVEMLRTPAEADDN